jgi:ribonuclease E
VVDVNTGKFTGSGGNLEQTVTKNNLEAAEEIVRQLRLRDIGGIVVIDFIDMVLESNRDLVLRRLTEALARDRTRHQVSEVTSLGLVQLTRKRLGTGLIEAFSSSCPNCGGRGLLLHSDPVDSAPTNGRKSESGGRRGRRSKKKGSDESSDQPTVAKVPAHAPGEHPMFKAMAAGASGAPEAAGDGSEQPDEAVEEVTAQVHQETEERPGVEETDREDFEDNGDDGDDEDELDDEDDLDDEDLGDDEDLDLDDDDDSDDDDSDDDDDDDLDDEDSDDSEDGGDARPAGSPFARRRRRAAGRPAGPPIHAD